jgi:hypothetical protein
MGKINILKVGVQEFVVLHKVPKMWPNVEAIDVLLIVFHRVASIREMLVIRILGASSCRG